MLDTSSGQFFGSRFAHQGLSRKRSTRLTGCVYAAGNRRCGDDGDCIERLPGGSASEIEVVIQLDGWYSYAA